MIQNKSKPSFLEQVSPVEDVFLAGKQDRGVNLETAVRIFLEFLHGCEALAMISLALS